MRAIVRALRLAPVGTIAAGRPFGLAGGPAPPEMVRDLSRSDDVLVFRVRGEVLLDRRIVEGDLVIAERRPPRRAGDLLVCRLPGGETTLCRHSGDGTPPERAVEGGPVPEESEVLGVVVGFMKKL